MEEILVWLNVKTTQCVPVNDHPCGEHGVCQEIHKGLLAYAACSCFGGRIINYSSVIRDTLKSKKYFYH